MTAPIDDVLDDVRDEYERINSILATLSSEQWLMPSAAPGWSIADTVLHLALTEELVVTSLAQGASGWTTRDRPLDDVIDDNVRDEQLTPAEIYERWNAARTASIPALASADPSVAVSWAAAPLRPRTLATTRLAEHWAHMLDIVEPLGIDYSDTERLRHIAWLGHATLPYAMRLDGLEPVDVFCSLTSPGGSTVTYGPSNAESTITGDMGAFCRVGARRLVGADSGLATTGPHAVDALRFLRNYAA